MEASRVLDAPAPPTAPRSRAGRVALWVGQIAVAAMFLMTGSAKLSGQLMTVATFEKIGVGQWFRYVTGAIEVGSAVGLLVPALAPFAAVLLTSTMVGATATHLFIIGGDAAPAVVLLVASIAIAWFRRDQLVAFVKRLSKEWEASR